MKTGTWSAQLADAVSADLARETTAPTVHSIRAVADDVLEVVFSWLGDDDLRGMRLDKNALDAATGRLMDHTLEETALDVVKFFVIEPRDIAEFVAVDDTGVRWLPLSDWIEEIS